MNPARRFVLCVTILLLPTAVLDVGTTEPGRQRPTRRSVPRWRRLHRPGHPTPRRFASLDAETEGTLTTCPGRFTGQHLFVNLAAPSGELRVEILDERGAALAPFTAANCAPLKGDTTRHTVRWQGVDDLKAIAGQPVKFRSPCNVGSSSPSGSAPSRAA